MDRPGLWGRWVALPIHHRLGLCLVLLAGVVSLVIVLGRENRAADIGPEQIERAMLEDDAEQLREFHEGLGNLSGFEEAIRERDPNASCRSRESASWGLIMECAFANSAALAPGAGFRYRNVFDVWVRRDGCWMALGTRGAINVGDEREYDDEDAAIHDRWGCL